MHRDEEVRLLWSKLAAAIVIRCGARDGVCALGAEYDRELEKKWTKQDLLDWGKQMQRVGTGERRERPGNGVSRAAQHCVVGMTVGVTGSVR